MSRQATQRDVARLAGVSTATVSRVLNGRAVVSADVVERVNQAIQSLQYVPHASARALAMQRTRVLGVLLPTLNNAIFAEGINAFEETARQHGYAMILSVSDARCAHHLDQVKRMIEQGVDGLLLVGNDHDYRVFDKLEHAGVKSVCAWVHDSAARCANVGFDNEQAMADLVDHLIELKHQRFGMLAGITAGNDRARARVAGAVARLNFHGVALEPKRIVEVEYSIKDSRRAFWQLIDNDLSAIICGNDVIAYGACLEAQKMGLAIPGDLSITGFDDLGLSAELSPALTTVRVHASAMGSRAALSLIHAIDNQMDATGCCLETQLIIRETTGPASTTIT